MLKGINPLLSPELLKILSEMGHGDEIIIADGGFPAARLARNLVRADAVGCVAMLDAVLSVFPLDQYDSQNFVLMETTGNDQPPAIWEEYAEVLKKHEPDAHIEHIERFNYYARAEKAYAVIATGEMAPYGNILLKKGCIR
ncbi:MAG: L-fucose mutarotase [Clostridia bacterium]|nr:L-fucose mutarotase [Clostridia bacterium]